MEPLNSGTVLGNFHLLLISVSPLHVVNICAPKCLNFLFCIRQDTEEGSLPESESNNGPGDAVTSSHNNSDSAAASQDSDKRVYLDLIPVRSFLHTPGGRKSPPVTQKDSLTHTPAAAGDQGDASSQAKGEVHKHN